MTDASRSEAIPTERPGYDQYLAARYFANLDGLRFICIAMVLWHHAPFREHTSIVLLKRGYLGVDFFFVLSGFLITTLLLRERRRFGDFSLRDFYIRRILRIVPVYLFVVLAVAGYYIVIKGEHDYLRLLPFYLLFLSNYLTEHIPTLAITWSLSVEEQYYLVWPLVLALLPARWAMPVLVGLIGASLLIAIGLLPSTEIRDDYLHIPLPSTMYIAILLGSLAACLLDHRASFERLALLLGHPVVPLVLFIVLGVTLQYTPIVLRGWSEFMVHVLMMLTLMSLLIVPRNVLTPILELPIVARIGVVSYGIYLYHLIAQDVALRFFGVNWAGQPVLTFALYCLMAWAFAELSFRTIEAGFRRLRPKSRSPQPPAR